MLAIIWERVVDKSNGMNGTKRAPKVMGCLKKMDQGAAAAAAADYRHLSLVRGYLIHSCYCRSCKAQF